MKKGIHSLEMEIKSMEENNLKLFFDVGICGWIVNFLKDSLL